MTNERIDHAAKAREVLAEIEQMDPQTQWVEMTQKQLVVTSHIGLASVEQQRIANLIAYGNGLDAQYAIGAEHPGLFDMRTLEASFERHDVAAKLVQEGLGL